MDLTPGVPVIRGHHYLMLFEAATVDPGIVHARNDAYPEGSGVVNPKGSDPGFSSFDVLGEDLAFAATFRTAVVPEPGTWLLLGTGLMGLGVIARRRRWESEPRA